jgi:hypothetical protein
VVPWWIDLIVARADGALSHLYDAIHSRSLLKVPSLTSRLTKGLVKDLRPVATTTVFSSQAKLRLPAGKKILYRWSRVV